MNEKELKLYAKKIGLDNKVTFTGFIKDAKKIISEIDILLFTSVEEGLGTTILDFFLAKKPVVCVKNGGSEDIVINDITGFICEKRDSEGLAKKILYLLQNQKIANNIVNNAYKIVKEKFSKEVVTEKIIECYKNK
jgi:glycosyltransferase involved in cell wall biosynthesis